MAIEVFNRFEHKFLMDRETYEKVIGIMDEHMDLDSHNQNHEPYTIANIYYDTEDDYLIRKSLEKPRYKEKLRLRAYGIPDADTKVYLEIKKKFNGIVNKRRTTLTLSEACEFTSSGQKPPLKDYMNKQVLNEIEYFLHIYDLRPKLYLAYDRIAYFERGNPDLRISFDCNIRSRRYDVRLDAGDYGKKLLNDGLYLMEVKTARAMPLWLSHMLAEYSIRRISFSKYGTEFRQMINEKALEKTSEKTSNKQIMKDVV